MSLTHIILKLNNVNVLEFSLCDSLYDRFLSKVNKIIYILKYYKLEASQERRNTPTQS